MEIVSSVVLAIWYTFNGLLSVLGVFLVGYFFFVAVLGWYRKEKANVDDFEIKTKFAVVVAAHNEKYVIEETIHALREADYPDELYDIYVVADNCTDDTAAIARKAGATVYERFNDEQKGKGYAVEWMFNNLWDTGIHYDAVCLLDADNLIDKNYFKEMNKSLQLGFKVVQGYLGCKNPHDTYISGCYSITYWVNNRIIQKTRYNLGLSCGIGGTGFVVDAELLKEFGWGSYCLTEDLEFQLRCVDADIKIGWNHDAVFYDEKPLKLKQSLIQRTRWMQGHSDCVERYFVKLFKKGIKEKKWIAFDNAAYLIQSYIYCAFQVVSLIGITAEVIIALGQLFGLWSIGTEFATFKGWLSGSVFTTCMTLFVVLVEKKFSWKIFGYCLIFPLYVFSWVPPIIKGWFTRDNNEWAHTEHKRAIKVDDVVSG